MNREELLERMLDVSKSGKSQLHMRSESIQQKAGASRIPMLKKGLKKKSKLLFIADLALPFNPETGIADDEFNPDCKFRPPYSATTVALMLKEMAKTNETLKNVLMQKAGVGEWDTSSEEFTKEDRQIFAKYRVPRVFTVPVVHVNIPVMTKNDFGRDYSISVKYGEDGNIVGEVPGVLKVNKFFRDKIFEEIAEYDAKVESGEIRVTDKVMREEKSEIWKKNPVSDVHPSNWITALELPLTNNYKLSADLPIDGFTADVAKQHLVLTKYSKGIKEALDNYTSGAWEKFDISFDYFEVDMNCPVDGDDSTQMGKMAIGKDTKFEKPTNTIEDELSGDKYVTFKKNVIDFLDSQDLIEEEVRRSMFISPYSEDVESQIYTSLHTVVDIDHDKFITQRVISENKEVMSLAFSDIGKGMLDEIEAGVSDLPEGNLDSDEASVQAKQYSLSELDSDGGMEENGVDLDMVDFAE